jgi:hypothetical protein
VFGHGKQLLFVCPTFQLPACMPLASIVARPAQDRPTAAIARKRAIVAQIETGMENSHAAAEPGSFGDRISPNSPARHAGEVQCLGEMPLKGRATAIEPGGNQIA